MSTRPARPRGFTLLEALIALVIAATVLLGFYQAVGQSAATAGRLAARFDAAEAQRNLLEVARVVNPMKTPQGILALTGYRVRWTATAIEEPRAAATIQGTSSAFRLGLYRLRLDLMPPQEDRVLASVSVDRAGWLREGPPPEAAGDGGNPPAATPGGAGFHHH